MRWAHRRHRSQALRDIEAVRREVGTYTMDRFDTPAIKTSNANPVRNHCAPTYYGELKIQELRAMVARQGGDEGI